MNCNANLKFNCTSMQEGGIPTAVLANITSLLAKLESRGLQQTTVAEAARLSLEYLAVFAERCSQLNSGALPWIRGHAAAKASLESTLAAAQEIHKGMLQLLSRCDIDPGWGGDAVGQKLCGL